MHVYTIQMMNDFDNVVAKARELSNDAMGNT